MLHLSIVCLEARCSGFALVFKLRSVGAYCGKIMTSLILLNMVYAFNASNLRGRGSNADVPGFRLPDRVVSS